MSIPILEFRPHDLIIKQVKDKDGEWIEIVNIEWRLATSASLLKHAKDLGVEVNQPDQDDTYPEESE